MRRAIVILAVILAACGGGAAVETIGGGDGGADCEHPQDYDKSGGYETTTTTECPTPGTLPARIDICHREGNGSFHVITISRNALPAHLAHGDIYPVPPEGCEHETTTTKPGHETTTTYKPHETTTTVKETTTTHGGGGTTTTIKTTTTTTGGGGTTTTVHTTTTTTGGGGTTTTSSSTTTSTSSPGRTTTTTSTSLPPPPPGTPTTTTIPIEQVFVRGAGTTCDREVPKIVITFGNLTQFDGHVGTLTMSDLNGNVLSVQPLTYQSGTTVFLLYPGTRVNADGTIADVPGWNINSEGFWVEDPSDAFLRDGVVLTYEVNPTATAIVSYPPASSGCNTPPGPTPPPRVPGQPTPPLPPPPGSGLPPTL